MKKRNIFIAIAVVAVVALIGTYVVLSSNPNSKIEKSLVSQTTFNIFGYDNKSEPQALNEEVNVDVLDWNPESIAINLETKNLSIKAIYDGLDAKLQFVEVMGEDGLIVSHFVNKDIINVEEGSLLDTYFKSLKIDQKDFVAYVNNLFNENELKAKFDKYKSAFAGYIEQNQ